MSVRFSGLGSKLALVFLGATLLSGCASWFDPNRWNGNDPDANRRAADPYGVDPQYSNPEEFSIIATGRMAARRPAFSTPSSRPASPTQVAAVAAASR